MRAYVRLDVEGGGRLEPSFEDAIARVRGDAFTRRDVLKLGGAFGAAAAFGPRLGAWGRQGSSDPRALRAARSTAHDARVAIIGAGLAGTTAAFRLAQQGVHVELFEARDRIGGRCWTARGYADGQTAEHGGEFIDTRHVHLLGLASELGLAVDDLFKGYPTGVVWPDWVGGRRFDHRVIAEQMRRISKAVTAVAHRIGIFGANGRPSDAAYYFGSVTDGARALDRSNMQEWLDQNVPGLSHDITDFLNETMASWYGLDMPDLSALSWIDFFVIPSPGGDERWHVRGGNDRVPHRAARRLPPGTLRLASALQSLATRRDGTYELVVSDSTTPVIADFVILASPWTTLRDVDLSDAGFDPYRLTAIQKLGMGTDVKLLLPYGQRPHTFQVAGGGIWSGGMEHTQPNFETWESSIDEPGTAGLVTVYAGGSGSTVFANPEPHTVAPAALATQIVGAIDQVVPGTQAAYSGGAWLDYWPGDPWTRGSYAAYLPGQWTKYWGYAGIPVGNVHFAGEHTSTYSQGFLNGGVESGQRTAIEIMRKLGIRVPASIASLPYTRIPGHPA
jgi:monoamine oxidase